MEETRLTKLTLTNPSQASSAEPMQQNQNTQSKKLYFKQSATEALHSAILLKARNPLGSDLQQQQQQQQQTSIINNTKLFKSNAEANKILCPKLANANTLLTISSTANSSQILNNINNLDNANSNNLNLIDSNQPNSENNNNNNNHMSFDELAELDSPLKIKENILASIRNLKPALIGLDPLRSSTSDDEDSHSDNIERKFKNFTKTNQNEPATAMDSSPAESEVIILSQNQNLKSNIQLKPQQQQQQTQFTLLKQPQQRHIYLRANSTNTAGATKTLTKLPNFASNLSIAAASQLNTNSTVISTPVLINKTGQLSKIQLSRATSKRGKEEALSNSSSSDEEEQQKEQCILPTNLKIVNSTSQPSFVSNNSSFKLQQLILNPNKAQAATTSTPIQLKQIDTNKNALLALNQPHITPVVNSAAAAAALAAAAQASSSNTNITPVVSLSTSSSSSSSSSPSSAANLNSSESELISSPSSSSSPSSLSFKSQKSSIDHEYTNSSLSAASPTSCCSSSATNDVGIDLHDDNSSTASEPTYARQPGFEHHAHEVVVMQKLPTTTPKNSANVNTNKTMLNKLKKGETCSSLLKQQQQTNGANKSTNKAKKKLCMMNSEVANLNVGISETVSGSELQNDRQNVQLKPISNKAKREPLPMRLRALPMSFWQQPNQPNVSPGVMYLPPLFKNEIESVESNDELLIEENKLIGSDSMQTSGSTNSTTTANNREIRISNANTDLLFKLFENIEQKDKKSLQLQLQSQLKMHRLSTQKPVKTLSKALIKGEDPCIVDAVTEGLFPLLRLDSRSETVHYLAFKTSESTLNGLSSNGLSNSSPLISSNPSLSSAVNNLPMLQLEQNYAQELSDVVAAL